MVKNVRQEDVAILDLTRPPQVTIESVWVSQRTSEFSADRALQRAPNIRERGYDKENRSG